MKANHEEMECDSKWAVCHALAISEPPKLPGLKMEGPDILLDWNITELWWWLATHFAFEKVIICPSRHIFLEGKCSVTSGSLTHKEQAKNLLDGLKGSANLEGFKAKEKIDSKTVSKKHRNQFRCERNFWRRSDGGPSGNSGSKRQKCPTMAMAQACKNSTSKSWMLEKEPPSPQNYCHHLPLFC